jgi:hypothetical protein
VFPSEEELFSVKETFLFGGGAFLREGDVPFGGGAFLREGDVPFGRMSSPSGGDVPFGEENRSPSGEEEGQVSPAMTTAFGSR